MSDGTGGIRLDESDAEYAVVGSLTVPDFLSFLEPLLIAPHGPRSGSDVAPAGSGAAPTGSYMGAAPTGSEAIAVLVVVAERAEFVTPVSRAVTSVLSVDDPKKVSVSTSEQLATLRGLVDGQLGMFGRDLIFIVFAGSGVLVAAVQYGLVMLRRKDFGRRRALGASQRLIVALLLAQSSLLGGIGASAGCSAAAVMLAATGAPLPTPSYFGAVAILALLTSTLAAVIPAFAAARRDPLRELRVP